MALVHEFVGLAIEQRDLNSITDIPAQDKHDLLPESKSLQPDPTPPPCLFMLDGIRAMEANISLPKAVFCSESTATGTQVMTNNFEKLG